MIAVLIFWIVLLFIFTALGDALLQGYNLIGKEDGRLSIVHLFFLGVAVGVFFACLLSLFTPLTKYLFLAILGATLIYWGVFRKRLFYLLQDILEEYISLSLVGKILMPFLGLIILYHSASISSSFDQYLYHMQHMKWLQEYGVVNGLANLHIRFGFNSSALSIMSLFSYHPDLKINFTALNGLCLFVLAMWLAYGMFKASNIIKSVVLGLTMIVMVHFYAMELSSTSTDIMVNILVVYLLLNCFFAKNIKELYLPLAIIPVLCVTLKLSSAPIIIISLFIFWTLLKEKKTGALLGVICMAGLISIVWIAQNILLTGYVVFPFPSIDLFSFDWKVPIERVEAEKMMTYNWARELSATDESSSFAWMATWYASLPLISKTIYILSLLAIALSPFVFLKLKKRNAIVLVGCITAIAGTLFGFMTAPALRFSMGFVLACAFIPLLYFTVQTNMKSKASLAVLCLSIVLFSFFHVNYIKEKIVEKMGMDFTYMRAQLIKPFPASYAKIGTEFLTVKMNNFQFYIPNNGKCYDYTLPCAPNMPGNIELRGNDVSSGFRPKE